MDGAGTVLQMVLSLAAVVVMILGLAWMTRRMQGLRVSSPQDLRVKATLAVGIKERVVLIEARGEQFLIGVAPGQVRLIQALGAVEVDSTQDIKDDGHSKPPSFSEAFKQQLQQVLKR